jgi:hypothetical protein
VNKGTVVLKDFSIVKSGANPGNFHVQAFGKKAIYPGESTTFEVTFYPTHRDKRTAELHILSNDKVTGRFDVKLVGKGVPTKGGAIAAMKSTEDGGIVEAVLGQNSPNSAAGPAQSTSLEVIDGQKYVTLTVSKIAGQDAGTIEVSSNLLDWYSGNKHTTILLDDATTLKVRDNTAVTPEAKRYIRLTPSQP